MRRAVAFAVLALMGVSRDFIVVAPSARAVVAGPDEITPATVVAVEGWVSAVANHVPGRRDAGVEMVLALTFEKRRVLNDGMGMFLSFLQGKPVLIKTHDEKQIAALAAAARQIPGANTFLKRAAMLHGDTACSRTLEGLGFPDQPGPRHSVSRPSALLSQGSLSVNQDGELLGETPIEWNWPFARSLLDLIAPAPAHDPFVATWYHATTAFMLQQHLYGEAVTHLQRAAIVLPEDARVLFDRASYAEILGLPRSQVLLSEEDMVAYRAMRSGRSSGIKTPAGSRVLDIPPEADTNQEAEQLFRRALHADPSLVEARVRLGRLLDLRKRHEDGAAELATALAANPTGPVLYYAHLFAGRAAQALGKIPAAAEHYKTADLLYPGSQSARLARSQAALLASDVAGALASIDHLDKSVTARDPWWWYHLAAGRDAPGLMKEMWEAVGRF